MAQQATAAVYVIVTFLAVGGCARPTAQRQFPVAGQFSAPVTVLVYEDLQCADCGKLSQSLERFQKRFPQEVQIIFKHNPLPEHPDAALAHEAVIEAEDQGKFSEMHDLLFANQSHLKEPDLLRLAARAGLDVQRMEYALKRRIHQGAVERDMAEGRALGLSKAPAVFVNGRRMGALPTDDQLADFIHKLAGNGTGGGLPNLPTLKPGDLDMTGSPVKGTPNAKITIVEFSDFRCGYCARVRSTIDSIVARYDGKIQWVFKHFPPSANENSLLAHRAALAASEQNKFWEMHDAIFRRPGRLTEADVMQMAASAGLDLKRFRADLQHNRFEKILERDKAEGDKLGIKGTPTFFINGKPVLGAAPEQVFVDAIESALGQ